MVYYYGRTFTSTSMGVRTVNVVCDKCGCAYLYELSRIGSGSETAPYALGSGRAERSAQDQAARDLERRLSDEAELVPCPKCHWINESLVAGYRLCRCRRWGSFGAGLAIVGTVISLLGVWFLSIGPEGDRGAIPYLLVGGPSLAIALAGLLLLARRLIRNRIQPNRDYPAFPKIPRGSPRPLIRNPTTGEIEPAGPTIETGDWRDFQIGRDQLPPICCGCLGPADPQAADQLSVPVIPICARCARRWKDRMRLGGLVAFGAAAAVVVPLQLVMKFDEVIFWIVAVPLVGIIASIGALVASTMVTPFRVKTGDGSRGVVLLWFRNEDYPRA